ncbi:hypothetical protein D352_00120 [Enterococcus faecium LA4B-2]|nr:hypothetical protein D352_00120 [Enterococcus faecium LA4B-2]
MFLIEKQEQGFMHLLNGVTYGSNAWNVIIMNANGVKKKEG